MTKIGYWILEFSQNLVLAIPIRLVAVGTEQDARHPVRRSAHLLTDHIQVNIRAAFERCIEVMSRLIMKYGPGLLEKMNQGKLKDLISAEIESGADKDWFSARMLGYCKLMTDRK